MQDAAEPSLGTVASEPMPPPFVLPPRRRKRGVLLLVLIAFALGGALAGWAVWHGDLDAVLPASKEQKAPQRIAVTVQPPAAAPALPAREAVDPSLGGVETRLALLEERFSRIDQQANAASANASRAEALLIALATRRMIDRGEPLGYLEYQLKLRFGGAQPEAVQTIIAASRKPVTLYLLSSQLEAAAPALTGERRDESTWARINRELSNLFVVRRGAATTTRAVDRTERAQVLLKAGRIEDAVAEVERLPGAEDARDWIVSARGYDSAQRALDLIETAAMLEPRELRDGEGLQVARPSPITAPTANAVTAP